MEVLKIYAPDNLKEVLQKDAKLKGLSMSELTVEVLMQHYGIAVPAANKKSLPEIIGQVIEEIRKYVKNPDNIGKTFDLLSVSETFKNIHMVADGKPSSNRATVGKVFASKLGKDDFINVTVVRTEAGAVKKSVNRATLYMILEEDSNENE